MSDSKHLEDNLIWETLQVPGQATTVTARLPSISVTKACINGLDELGAREEAIQAIEELIAEFAKHIPTRRPSGSVLQ